MLTIEPQDAVENFRTVFHNFNEAQFTGLKPNTNYRIQLLSNLGFHLETTQTTSKLDLCTNRSLSGGRGGSETALSQQLREDRSLDSKVLFRTAAILLSPRPTFNQIKFTSEQTIPMVHM